MILVQEIYYWNAPKVSSVATEVTAKAINTALLLLNLYSLVFLSMKHVSATFDLS